ncbi:transposase [Thermoflexus sp.]|uniref:transposase n=1 Tax=Thermoflexus sp. TaxID=1969742 RepID=UPI0035E465D7
MGSPVGPNDRKRGPRGDDAGKQVNGRKRPLLLDSLGWLLTVVVHPAHGQDWEGAPLVLEKVQSRRSRLRRMGADGGDAGPRVPRVKTVWGWVLEVVQRTDHGSGFPVRPRRWGMERPLAGLGKDRRRSKDDEALPETSEPSSMPR